MRSQEELITNISYKDLFSNSAKIERASYIASNFDDLNSSDTGQLTLSLALLLQKFDPMKSVLYGIEITSDGKDRKIRLPLVRISDENQTVWKVITDLKKLERAVETLNDIEFFLGENNSSGYPLPTKVVVVKESREYLEDNIEFVRRIVNKNNLILFTLNFLKDLIQNEKVGDLDKLLKQVGVTHIS